MKKEEFHIPFIKDLIFVAMVTVILATSAHFFLSKSYFPDQNTPIFTSSKSQYTRESRSE